VQAPQGILLIEASPVHSELPAGLPVANRPLAVHALLALARAGAQRVVVAVPADARPALLAALSEAAPENVDLDVVRVLNGAGLRGALAAVHSSGADGPLVVHSGDYLFLDDLVAPLARLHDEHLDALLLTDSRVCDGSAPAAGGPVLSGVQLLAGPCMELMDRVAAEYGHEPNLEDLATALRLGAQRVSTAPVEPGWRYADDAASILEVNRLVLEGIEHDPAPVALTASDVQGRVNIHPTAHVVRSLVRGPVVIGPRAHVTDAYVGPYTTIGPDAVLEGTEIEHSVVYAGTTIRHIGVRLESSVIGADASVSRHFALPKALHLHVGPRARVTLS
jgi:glucose-1-phosphate thymidylyltransferase